MTVVHAEYIDSVFALTVAALLWLAFFVHTVRDGQRRRARRHLLNSSKED